MRTSIARNLPSLVLAAGLLSPGVASAAPWIADGAWAEGDFDNDGNSERVVAVPEDTGDRGVVFVVDGAAASVTTWTRNASGLAGLSASEGDYFGAALAVGDFDGDGYDDLVIGVPGADDAGPSDAGAVHILYGSSGGLTTVGDQLFHQDTTGINGVAEAGDQLGEVLTTGDFDCDGYDDLVIGTPREGLGSAVEAGATHVIYGGSGGLTTTDDLWKPSVGGVDGAQEDYDHFGGAVVAGNFNGDSNGTVACDDLAIASPDEDVGSIVDAGFLYSMLGSTSGLSTTGDFVCHQNTSGVADTAQAGDRFGTRLLAADEDGDGYDDIAVVVPGDSCSSPFGEARAMFAGSSSGLTVSGDRLECFNYRCEIDEDTSTYACGSLSPTVHGASGSEQINMFVGDDIVLGKDGADELLGSWGDDTLFGGAGNDILDGGPGLDLMIGGGGDDTFIIDSDCEVISGEVIDGGDGNNVVLSHLSRTELIAAGVELRSVSVVTATEVGHTCDVPPYEEGPFASPRMQLTWDDLPDADTVYTTANSELDLHIANTSDQALDVIVEGSILVQGYAAELTSSTLSVGADRSITYALDVEDFIPSGFDTSGVHPDLLELKTSAELSIRVKISNKGTPLEYSYAPALYGHLVSSGATMVVYRSGAYADIYHHGDLMAFAQQLPPYSGPGRLLGRVEFGVKK